MDPTKVMCSATSPCSARSTATPATTSCRCARRRRWSGSTRRRCKTQPLADSAGRSCTNAHAFVMAPDKRPASSVCEGDQVMIPGAGRAPSASPGRPSSVRRCTGMFSDGAAWLPPTPLTGAPMTTDELPEAARAFLDGDVELLPAALDDAAGEALVALLVERGDAARLQRLGDGADKALAKRARKALHVLRTRGVAAPKAEKREFPPARPVRAGRGAVAGVDDRRTRRAHRLAGARGRQGARRLRGAAVGHARHPRLHHGERAAQGLARARARASSPTSAWRWRASPSATRGSSSRRATGARSRPGACRPRSSRARGSAWATTSPKSAIPRSTPAPPLDVAEVRARLATLHALPELRTWIPPEESLPALDLEVGNIVTSKLIVDPLQRKEQLAAAVEKVATAALTPDYRAAPRRAAARDGAAARRARQARRGAPGDDGGGADARRARRRAATIRSSFASSTRWSRRRTRSRDRVEVLVHVAHGRFEEAVAVFGARQVVVAPPGACAA